MAKIYGLDDVELSKNFSLSEMIRSRAADTHKIKNVPSKAQLVVIRYVVEKVAQPIRDKIAAPLFIGSAFRNAKTNALAGGVDESYHLYDEGRFALDIHAPSMSLMDLLETVRDLNLPLTKCIIELDQGVLHVQGIMPEFLVRDVIEGTKKYVFYDAYKKTGKIA